MDNLHAEAYRCLNFLTGAFVIHSEAGVTALQQMALL